MRHIFKLLYRNKTYNQQPSIILSKTNKKFISLKKRFYLSRGFLINYKALFLTTKTEKAFLSINKNTNVFLAQNKRKLFIVKMKIYLYRYKGGEK